MFNPFEKMRSIIEERVIRKRHENVQNRVYREGYFDGYTYEYRQVFDKLNPDRSGLIYVATTHRDQFTFILKYDEYKNTWEEYDMNKYIEIQTPYRFYMTMPSHILSYDQSIGSVYDDNGFANPISNISNDIEKLEFSWDSNDDLVEATAEKYYSIIDDYNSNDDADHKIGSITVDDSVLGLEFDCNDESHMITPIFNEYMAIYQTTDEEKINRVLSGLPMQAILIANIAIQKISTNVRNSHIAKLKIAAIKSFKQFVTSCINSICHQYKIPRVPIACEKSIIVLN